MSEKTREQEIVEEMKARGFTFAEGANVSIHAPWERAIQSVEALRAQKNRPLTADTGEIDSIQSMPDRVPGQMLSIFEGNTPGQGAVAAKPNLDVIECNL